MASTFAASKASQSSLTLGREQINSVLLGVLKDNPEFNGTYSCWEQDALDGKDLTSRDAQDGSNPLTGRFTPYWTRSPDGRVAVQPLVEYDSADSHLTAFPKAAGTGPEVDAERKRTGPYSLCCTGEQRLAYDVVGPRSSQRKVLRRGRR